MNMSDTAVQGALTPVVHPAAGIELEAASQSSMLLGAASSNSHAMPGSSTSSVSNGSATAQSSLPMRKRKQEALEAEEANAAVSAALSQEQLSMDLGTGMGQQLKRAPMTKAREVRLEQNRKAARESRRRKKIMIEELQRSVVFFSRANGTLKHQNDELQRLLLNAQSRISNLENNASGAANANAGMNVNVNANANVNNANNALNTAQVQVQAQVANQDHSSNSANSVVQVPQMQAMTMNLAPQQNDSSLPNNQLIKEDPTKNNDVRDVQAQQAVASAQAQAQAQVHAVQAQAQAAQAAATQAMFQNQGFPPAAARAAAQTFVAGPPPAANGATGHDVQVQQALANNLSSIMMGMPVNQMQGQVQVQNQVQQVQNQVQNQASNDNNANLGVSMSAPVAAASTQQIQNAFLAMQQLTQMQHAQQPGSNQNQAQVQAPAPVGNMFQNAFAPMGVQVPVSLQPAPAPAPIANNMNVSSPSDLNDATI